MMLYHLTLSEGKTTFAIADIRSSIHCDSQTDVEECLNTESAMEKGNRIQFLQLFGGGFGGNTPIQTATREIRILGEKHLLLEYPRAHGSYPLLIERLEPAIQMNCGSWTLEELDVLLKESDDTIKKQLEVSLKDAFKRRKALRDADHEEYTYIHVFVTEAKVKQIDFMINYFDDKKKRLEIVRLEIKRKEERKAKRKEEREAKRKKVLP